MENDNQNEKLIKTSIKSLTNTNIEEILSIVTTIKQSIANISNTDIKNTLDSDLDKTLTDIINQKIQDLHLQDTQTISTINKNSHYIKSIISIQNIASQLKNNTSLLNPLDTKITDLITNQINELNSCNQKLILGIQYNINILSDINKKNLLNKSLDKKKEELKNTYTYNNVPTTLQNEINSIGIATTTEEIENIYTRIMDLDDSDRNDLLNSFLLKHKCFRKTEITNNELIQALEVYHKQTV